MHPFSLKKENLQQVTGGNPIPGLSLYFEEEGGQITMAIPEDGYDPRDLEIS